MQETRVERVTARLIFSGCDPDLSIEKEPRGTKQEHVLHCKRAEQAVLNKG